MEGPRWGEQKDAVAATGASYDQPTRTWYLWVDLDDLPIDKINALFAIARKYGTIVTFSIPDEPATPATPTA